MKKYKLLIISVSITFIITFTTLSLYYKNIIEQTKEDLTCREFCIFEYLTINNQTYPVGINCDSIENTNDFNETKRFWECGDYKFMGGSSINAIAIRFKLEFKEGWLK